LNSYYDVETHYLLQHIMSFRGAGCFMEDFVEQQFENRTHSDWESKRNDGKVIQSGSLGIS